MFLNFVTYFLTAQKNLNLSCEAGLEELFAENAEKLIY